MFWGDSACSRPGVGAGALACRTEINSAFSLPGTVRFDSMCCFADFWEKSFLGG
ncbi:hypothetical protein L195_g062999, partial [Trifolium pratense]